MSRPPFVFATNTASPVAFTAAPGTYQVSVAKTGCTFSPTSQTVTLTDNHVVLPNFVAIGSCK